ncbi:TetR/AcrR family transcriptional regulator [Paenibacillus albiflavus]|uniref:TetR/AcrR family transcriptional regulator n=1 Tax=Paenibacillus albiflavus TaxID=2545760 RepID=A0A4R4EEL2_9BACL|nr:TetR/AcrR family transcriptional regulator [Paenibacillus albiflavus]TCZ76611.1 TetR/AcrR family transcriptional regulator [Paenibacillus albiflavus]
MSKKQELRSEETKKSIITAAYELFAVKGYEAVTMREIAKQAGCSHTTIYIYFKDKEVLLYELSKPALLELKSTLKAKLEDHKLPADERIKAISRHFIDFCLMNHNMYLLIIMTQSSRVDQEPQIQPELNTLRIELFSILNQALQEYLQLSSDDKDKLLSCSRIYFYMLQGIVSTYHLSEESSEDLFKRLDRTFEEAFEVLLTGFRYREGMHD